MVKKMPSLDGQAIGQSGSNEYVPNGHPEYQLNNLYPSAYNPYGMAPQLPSTSDVANCNMLISEGMANQQHWFHPQPQQPAYNYVATRLVAAWVTRLRFAVSLLGVNAIRTSWKTNQPLWPLIDLPSPESGEWFKVLLLYTQGCFFHAVELWWELNFYFYSPGQAGATWVVWMSNNTPTPTFKSIAKLARPKIPVKNPSILKVILCMNLNFGRGRTKAKRV